MRELINVLPIVEDIAEHLDQRQVNTFYYWNIAENVTQFITALVYEKIIFSYYLFVQAATFEYHHFVV